MRNTCYRNLTVGSEASFLSHKAADKGYSESISFPKPFLSKRKHNFEVYPCIKLLIFYNYTLQSTLERVRDILRCSHTAPFGTGLSSGPVHYNQTNFVKR